MNITHIFRIKCYFLLDYKPKIFDEAEFINIQKLCEVQSESFVLYKQ